MIKRNASKVLRFIWQFSQNRWVLFYLNFFGSIDQRMHARVFYGGAMSGNRGGPRVKVKRLHEIFPNRYLGFNLVYVLSNFPYLSEKTIRALNESQIPLVLNQNGAYWPGWYGSGWEEKNRPNALVYRNCDYVFWQSNFAREASRIFLSGVDPMGEVLFNAVNLDSFFPRRSTLRNKDFTFLVAGNFNSDNFYQIEGAFRAFAKIYRKGNYRLQVLGLNQSMKKQARLISIDLGIEDGVEVLGKFSQAQGAQIMRQSDTYLALKFMDTCPNLVIEALASGVPVIFSDTGGTSELVDNNCGYGLHVEGNWYSQPKAPDSDLLAEAMQSIVHRRWEMGEAARFRAEEHFDLRRWHLRHKTVFNQLLEVRGQVQ